MRVLVLFAIASIVTGCAASSADDGDNGPDAAAKPPGSGWACFRDRTWSDSICDRPANCEPRRQAYAAELDRRGVGYDLTTCTARPGVACFTFRLTTATSTAYMCKELMSECDSMRRFALDNPRDFTDVSDCGTW